MLTGAALLVVVSLTGTSAAALSVGLYAIAIAFVAMYVGARILLTLQPTTNVLE